jgi:hypothetical protein
MPWYPPFPLFRLNPRLSEVEIAHSNRFGANPNFKAPHPKQIQNPNIKCSKSAAQPDMPTASKADLYNLYFCHLNLF